MDSESRSEESGWETDTDVVDSKRHVAQDGNGKSKEGGELPTTSQFGRISGQPEIPRQKPDAADSTRPNSIATDDGHLSDLPDIRGGHSQSSLKFKNSSVNQNTKDHPQMGVTGGPKLVSSRHGHERVDGLLHLCESMLNMASHTSQLIQKQIPEPTLPSEFGIHDMQPLSGIVFCLVYLNIKILESRDSAHDVNSFDIFSKFEKTYMDGLITREEHDRWHSNSRREMDSAQEVGLAEYVSGLPREQMIQRIRDPKALPYLPKLLEDTFTVLEQWTISRRMLGDPNFDILQDYKDNTREEVASKFIRTFRHWRQRLRDIYNITLQLKKYAICAGSSNLLDDISLRQLKHKMIALQPGFWEACQVLDETKEILVSKSQKWWLDPSNPEPDDRFLDSQPKNVVAAFPPPSNKNTNSALTFLVPVLSLLSCIPTALAWAYSPHQHGTISDADFYQLISSTAMQLLGNLTLIIPTISNTRLVGQPWFWTWVLAGISTVCAIVAVPLYLTVPTEWSAALSFASNVMQAFVTLQLMFAL